MTPRQAVRAKGMELAIQYATMVTKFLPPGEPGAAEDPEGQLVKWILDLSTVFEKRILAVK